jgi:GT2 family glycosyltransferase
MDKISIIIPILLHNEFLSKMTNACLSNIREYAYSQETEIIIIHNQSQLGDFLPALELRPWDIYLPQKEQSLRLGKCMNIGIEAATTDYLCILANDVMIGQNCLQNMKETLDKGDLDIVQAWLRRYGRKSQDDILEISHNSTCVATFSESGGSCSMFKRETYEKIGPFDENLFVRCDRDYLYRIEALGMRERCGININAHATHLGSMTWIQKNKPDELFGFNFDDGEYHDTLYLQEKYKKS